MEIKNYTEKNRRKTLIRTRKENYGKYKKGTTRNRAKIN